MLFRPALILFLASSVNSFHRTPSVARKLFHPRNVRLMTSLLSKAASSSSSPPQSLPMIDIGANLLDPMFSGVYGDKPRHPSDFDLMLRRSVKGLNAPSVADGTCSAIIITAGTLSESRSTAALAKSLNERCVGAGPSSTLLCEADQAFAHELGWRRLFSTVGLHPTRASEMFTEADPTGQEYVDALSAFIEEQGEESTVVALGELGLDYDRLQFCDKETQLKALAQLLPLSSKHSLPLFLHNRACGTELLDALRSNPSCTENGGVVHSFDGSLDLAHGFISLGLHIGLNGCSLRTAENLDVVRQLPLESIMIETDAPWCDIRPTHAGHRFIQSWKDLKGKDPKKFIEGETVKGRNEPMFLRWVLEVVAGAKEESVEKCAEVFFENSRKVFFKSSTQRK